MASRTATPWGSSTLCFGNTMTWAFMGRAAYGCALTVQGGSRNPAPERCPKCRVTIATGVMYRPPMILKHRIQAGCLALACLCASAVAEEVTLTKAEREQAIRTDEFSMPTPAELMAALEKQ